MNNYRVNVDLDIPELIDGRCNPKCRLCFKDGVCIKYWNTPQRGADGQVYYEPSDEKCPRYNLPKDGTCARCGAGGLHRRWQGNDWGQTITIGNDYDFTHVSYLLRNENRLCESCHAEFAKELKGVLQKYAARRWPAKKEKS